MKNLTGTEKQINYANDKSANIITYQKANADDCNWYKIQEGSYILTLKQIGWFPTKIIMGIDKNGKYVDTYNIGAVNRGNLGSAGIAVLNFEVAKSMLEKAGYILEPYVDYFQILKNKMLTKMGKKIF